MNKMISILYLKPELDSQHVFTPWIFSSETSLPSRTSTKEI